MFKRTTDVACAIILLVITLPILLIAAVLIKLDTEGPVLFNQPRMGRRFRRFQLYKLRTMNLTGVGSPYTLGADPRITRVGFWLRRYKIDELPQLWNVMRGEMSIVGPRPVIPELALEFRWAYARLLDVRPGLTDPASLRYCNETEILSAVRDPYDYFKSVVTPDKIRISQDYLKCANLWTDLAVAGKTALALVLPAYKRRISQEIPEHSGTRVICFPANSESTVLSPISQLAAEGREFRLPAPMLVRPRRSPIQRKRRLRSI